MRCSPVRTWRTVAAAVLVTLSEFFGSASSRKHSPRTAATPSCAERKLLHYGCGANDSLLVSASKKALTVPSRHCHACVSVCLVHEHVSMQTSSCMRGVGVLCPGCGYTSMT